MEQEKQKSSARQRADAVKPYQCKNLIAVIEDPKDIKNIGTIHRDVTSLLTAGILNRTTEGEIEFPFEAV